MAIFCSGFRKTSLGETVLSIHLIREDKSILLVSKLPKIVKNRMELIQPSQVVSLLLTLLYFR